MAIEQEGIVYVLTNPVMPGIVKIGKTIRNDVKARMAELYSTGVPLPFECAYAAKVANVSQVERAFHQAFDPSRVNPGREFFEINPEQAIVLLKLLEIKDMSSEVESEPDALPESELIALRSFTNRRPRFDFDTLSIPIGSTLTNITTGEEATVHSNRSVQFRGEIMSLTAATRLCLNGSFNVAPGPYWLYEGRKLRELYNETYQ